MPPLLSMTVPAANARAVGAASRNSSLSAVFPLIRGLTPWLTQILLVRDQRRFRPPAQPVVVVSHTALRLLTLAQSQVTPPPPLSPTLTQALHTLQTTTGATVIVLDIAPAIRQQRIIARVQQGTVDPFDHYMLADIERAERIEQSLVTLATVHLHAVVIENNNLADDALTAALADALTPSAIPPEHPG